MPAHSSLHTTVVLVAANKAALDAVVNSYEEGQLGITKDNNQLFYVKINDNVKSWVRVI